MKKYLLVLMFLAVLVLPVMASAQTIAELQAMIAQLQAILAQKMAAADQSATAPAPLPSLGVCGAAAYVAYNTVPSDKLCLIGTPSKVTSYSGTNYWTCSGTNGGGTKTCSGPFAVLGQAAESGQCGAAAGIPVKNRPEEKLCVNSAPTLPVLAGERWSWTCAGENAVQQPCAAPYVATNELRIVSFTVTPATVAVGGKVKFNYLVQNGYSATGGASCVVTGSNGYRSAPLSWSSKATFESAALTAGSHTFTLTCSLVGVTKTAQRTVSVGAEIPQIVSFDITPASISLGQSVGILWRVKNVDSCAFTGELIKPATTVYSGIPLSYTPTTAGTKTLTLTCQKGTKSVQETRTITVGSGTVLGTDPFITAFEIAPETIAAGQTARVSWDSRNASACVLTGVNSRSYNVGTSGSMNYTPTNAGTKAISISCEKNGINVRQAKNLVVTTAPVVTGEEKFVSVTISPDPNGYKRGATAEVRWKVENIARVIPIWVNVATGASGYLYTSDSGAHDLAGGNIYGTGISWSIPSTLADGEYLIQVFKYVTPSSAGDSGARTPDMKSAQFTISGAVSAKDSKLSQMAAILQSIADLVSALEK